MVPIKAIDSQVIGKTAIRNVEQSFVPFKTVKDKLAAILEEYSSLKEAAIQEFGVKEGDKEWEEVFSLGKTLGEGLENDPDYQKATPQEKLKTFMDKLDARKEVRDEINKVSSDTKVDLNKIIQLGKLNRKVEEGKVIKKDIKEIPIEVMK